MVILLGLGGAALAIWEGYVRMPVQAPPANITPANTPSAGGVYLVGAGDIGECGLNGAGLTANLLARFPGGGLMVAAFVCLGLTIALSKINTEGNKVADVFYVNELSGTKVSGPERVKEIRERILSALSVPLKQNPEEPS